MPNIIDKISRLNDEYELFSSGDHIFVGLSGGADSVCLLLALNEFSERYSLKISAIHVNHMLRGDESERDERFCVELCKSQGIEIFTRRIDVPSIANERKISFELAAREARYQAFNEIAKDSLIATAHTLPDNAETIVHNIIRGTALKGLTGIPIKREGIIRPLINCTRKDVEDYLENKEQSFVTDSTNLSLDYTRNKIRHSIIPIAEQINSGFYESISRMTQSLMLDEDYLSSLVDELLQTLRISENVYRLEEITNKHKAIQMRFCAKILKNHSIECSHKNVSSIYNLLQNSGKINIAKNVYIISKMGNLKIVYGDGNGNAKNDVYEKVDFSNSNTFFYKKIKYTVKNVVNFQDTAKIQSLFAKYVLDYDKIIGETILRNRRPGDKIKFHNKSHTTSIKKLLNSCVELEKRDEIIFLEDEKGLIFVEGFGICDRVAVDSSTKKLLILEIKGSKNHG